MKLTIGFHSDYVRQILAVEENLADCSLTDDSERTVLGTEIQKSMPVVRSSARYDDLRSISDVLYSTVTSKNLFLKGMPRVELVGRRLWTTYPQVKLEGQVRRELVIRDPDLEFDVVTLSDRVQAFIQDLQSSLMLKAYKSTYSDFCLQTRMQPHWFGDPTSSKPPVKDIAIFPAVAGVAPKVGTHYKLTVNLSDIRMPRFADSLGYPYWIPGGRTNPLAESGRELGVMEAISGLTTVKDIIEPIEMFNRSI